MYFEYRSIEDLNNAILTNLSLFQQQFDLIVGIPRSGMLPANLIALYLNKPFTDIDSFIEGRVYSSGERGSSLDEADINKVLVVDDSVMSGRALSRAKEKLDATYSSGKYDIKYGVVYATADSKHLVDIYCETINYRRVFQWNIFHHRYISRSCLDIDGVLCQNPPLDDDGPVYLEYITNAIPLYLPSVEIDTLVTCRLEKYRKPTEEWLAKHGVRYKRLVMLDMPTRDARRAWGQHGAYKGEVYKKSKCVLFVESSLREAAGIVRVSGKPVFCTENFAMTNPHAVLGRANYDIGRVLKKLIRRKKRRP